MVLVFVGVYCFFGWLLLEMFGRFLQDCQEKAKAENWGLLKKWAPEFITLALFITYVLAALNSLAGMDWSFVNK